MIAQSYGSEISDIQKAMIPIQRNEYVVMVKYKDTVSDNMLLKSGLVDSGDPDTNRMMHNQMTTIQITIETMLTYFERGNRIVFRDLNNAKVIYDIVNAYLKAWANYLSSSLNKVDPPVNDLLVMDSFAKEIYPVAEYHKTADQETTLFIRRLRAFKDPITQTTTISNNAEPAEHNSLAKIFMRNSGALGKENDRSFTSLFGSVNTPNGLGFKK